MNDDASEILPNHIEDTVRATAQLHAEHHREATPSQRGVDRITAAVGRPSFALLILAVVALWILINLLGEPDIRFDPPPFNGLSAFASVAALVMTVLILTTQRRQDRLGERRAQLTLQLALVNEQKNSKIIELIEHLRRDHPEIDDRIDAEAVAMARPARPSEVLDKINRTSRELEP